MFYYTCVSVAMYCTKCAIYSTAALTQAWEMIAECEFIGNQVTQGFCARHAIIDLDFLPYIMFGIATKNYVIRPDSNSYLGQQSLENMKVDYRAMAKICKGGWNMFPYLGDICCVSGGITDILGYCVTLFIPKYRLQN